jgi:hypothetical protein
MDAYYGTDAGPPETDGCERGKSYNPKRGEEVLKYCYKFLDSYFTLKEGSYNDIKEIKVNSENQLLVTLKNGIFYLLFFLLYLLLAFLRMASHVS